MKMRVTIPLKGANQKTSSSPNHDDLICEVSSQLGLEHFESENHFGVLIGKIYDLGVADFLAELPTWYTAPEAVTKHSGRFIVISIEKSSQKITIWTDKYRLLGAFAGVLDEYLIVSNYLESKDNWYSRFFKSAKFEPRAIADLMVLGFVQPPMTLFQGIEMLVGRNDFSYQSVARGQSCDWVQFWSRGEGPAEGGGLSPQHFLNAFNKALGNILSNFEISHMRLSGGADTRLIASQLSEKFPEHMAKLSLQVVCSPFLEESQDWDVLGAKQIAKKVGKELQVLHFEASKTGFFSELPRKESALAGLYGGEFLGGVCYGPLPELDISQGAPEADLQALGVSDSFFKDVLQRKAKFVDSFGFRVFLQAVYLNAFRSTIYRSVKDSWAAPQNLGQYGISPFVESNVLDFLFSKPLADLENYSFYRRIYVEELHGSWRAIPICSPISTGNPEAFSAFQQGVNPKTVGGAAAKPSVPVEAIKLLRVLGIGQVPCFESLESSEDVFVGLEDHIQVRLKHLDQAIQDYRLGRLT